VPPFLKHLLGALPLVTPQGEQGPPVREVHPGDGSPQPDQESGALLAPRGLGVVEPPLHCLSVRACARWLSRLRCVFLSVAQQYFQWRTLRVKKISTPRKVPFNVRQAGPPTNSLTLGEPNGGTNTYLSILGQQS